MLFDVAVICQLISCPTSVGYKLNQLRRRTLCNENSPTHVWHLVYFMMVNYSLFEHNFFLLSYLRESHINMLGLFFIRSQIYKYCVHIKCLFVS